MALTATPGRAAGNRQGYLVALLPLLLLAATSVASFAHRVVASHTSDPVVGGLSRSDAGWVARLACGRVTGGTARTVEAAPQSAYAVRRQVPVYGWNVRCRTADSDFLVRVNARTFRVYGIARIIPAADNVVPAPASGSSMDGRRLSRRDAEQLARRYLCRVGLPADSVTHLSVFHSGYSVLTAEWTFLYRNPVSRGGTHTLSVTVDARDGRLVNLWDPAHGV
jgi:hypothetical protein